VGLKAGRIAVCTIKKADSVRIGARKAMAKFDKSFFIGCFGWGF